MGLTKYKLGELLETYDERTNNPSLTEWDVSGINRDKEFFEPSRQVGKDTSKYKIVPNNYFACNLMHVGRDIVLPVAFNHSQVDKVVSPAYTIFKLKEDVEVLNEYLFMYFNSKEKDRFFWFFTDASIRDGLSWDDFCDIEIELPTLDIQKKYVAVYKALLENQKAYEEGLEDLKLACDASIEKLIKTERPKKLGSYIVESQNKNTRKNLKKSSVRGISIDKKFIYSKANLKNVNLANYKIVHPEDFAYVTVTSRNSEKISIAMNHSEESYLCSSTYIVFSIKDKTELYPSYLKLLLTRSEFDRYARFNSWGSARETFNWDDMCDIEIPVPNLNIQKSIADIYTTYIERKEINEQLKTRLKNICPILIKGAMEEASREEV